MEYGSGQHHQKQGGSANGLRDQSILRLSIAAPAPAAAANGRAIYELT